MQQVAAHGDLMLAEDRIAELQDKGFCLLKAHFSKALVAACREWFWPILLDYLKNHHDKPNRGTHRHFLAMPFESPCFAPEFFFDPEVLSIVQSIMDERVVADQWSCDVAAQGSTHQGVHVDYPFVVFL
jgi:hypothetical protein